MKKKGVASVSSHPDSAEMNAISSYDKQRENDSRKAYENSRAALLGRDQFWYQAQNAPEFLHAHERSQRAGVYF